MISRLTDCANTFNLTLKDENGREIFIYEMFDANIDANTLFYPNCIIHSGGYRYNPIDERIMSLLLIDKEIKLSLQIPNKTIDTPVFYFIYNTENYYHFIYDTLPYLNTFIFLRNKMPNIRLLMNYPNPNYDRFYRFVIEFLCTLNIYEKDILIVDPNVKYGHIYISSSYTHGIDSNLPPRSEIFDLYQKINSNIISKNMDEDFPKKIYVSRRSWLNGDKSNIGTDYTSRRKMINEDELVEYLKSKGFVEVFTENYSVDDKILMFNRADHIIGAIGGGISNVLFSRPSCRLTAIVSPTFLDINYRFKYSLDNVNVTYFNDTSHESKEEWKKYMRVKVMDSNIIGEIIDISLKTITISYADEFIAGWNNSVKYKTLVCDKINCEKLDNGLNSPWKINMEKFKLMI